MQYDISYVPHSTIKSHDLADFMAKWMKVQTTLALVDQEY
jgi:hypothetical protein